MFLRLAGCHVTFKRAHSTNMSFDTCESLGSVRTTCRARSAKLIASGEVDDPLLEALEDYVKRQRKQPIGAKARGVFPSRRARHALAPGASHLSDQSTIALKFTHRKG